MPNRQRKIDSEKIEFLIQELSYYEAQRDMINETLAVRIRQYESETGYLYVRPKNHEEQVDTRPGVAEQDDNYDYDQRQVIGGKRWH